ncbi:cytochrome c [Micromonospora sp. NPDC049559]|uniref:cytochrome bc1 complex diheme cytochrome c subunit n=1 Tax=Micromonospora sp. NPDC049559 TaxID=3155923 RepID=UPI00343B5BC4
MTSDIPRPGDRRRGVLARLRRGRSTPRSKGRRRVGAALRLLAALTLAGGAYTVFAPGLQAQDTPQLSSAAQDGKALFDTSCVTCHGRNAQGIEGRGPSLIGVGSASVEFQVGTGRMPLARQEAQAERKPPVFTDEQTRQLGQYIQELGGGPQIPQDVDHLAAGGDVATGGELFRINCSSCHTFGGGGGALTSGKYAPTIRKATDREIYAAMLTGPQNMPVFGDNQLRPEEKADIIAYVQKNLQENNDPGGFNLGRLGPTTEGLVIFLVGIVALIFASLWIAGKS